MDISARRAHGFWAGPLGRALTVATAVVALSVVPNVLAPAHACACGGILLGEGESASVHTEEAILSWDGQTEEIVLSMAVSSQSATMALLIPTPAPATVDLADPGAFTELDRFTEPAVVVEKSWWPADDDADTATAPQPVVTVIDRIELEGISADVLAAADADGLAAWLDTNGYVMRDNIAAALTPYIQQKWYFVAIALDGTDFSGQLDPLRISFPAKQLVYPMRMSAAGTGGLGVRTYVFAEHRMERVDPMGGQVLWAGPVTPTDFVNDTLVELAGDHGFLTLWHQEFDGPDQIVSDMVFAAASADTPAGQTVVLSPTRMILGVPAAGVLLGGGAIAAGVAAWWVGRRRNRART